MVVGACLGVGTAFTRVKLSPWVGVDPAKMVSTEEPVDEDAPHPQVVVEEVEHDFGVMDTHASGRHEFLFTNAGEAPLELEAGDTSCSCTASILKQGTIAPGESGSVAVEWTGGGKLYLGGFSQTATIITNDPAKRRVVLKITGRITVAIQATPAKLVFSGITAGEVATAQLRLFLFRPGRLEITGHEAIGTSQAENFEVTFRPMPTEEVKNEEEDATSGVMATITVKPGLPLGAFRQKIRLQTNSEEAPTIEIPISGMINSEISIVGSGWDSETGVLRWGSVSGRAGDQRTLIINAGGPHHKEVNFKLIEKVPDLLEVKLGQTTQLENGRVAITPLTIQIPQGSPPANYLGSEGGGYGRITLQTNHPKAPELRVFLHFAIEG